MKNQTNVELKRRDIFDTTFIKVEIKRTYQGNVYTDFTPEKVIPLVLKYNEDGSYVKQSAHDLLEEVKPNPYYAGSKQFSQEKVDGVTLSNLYTHFQHFPTLNPQVIDGKYELNPLSQMIYGSIIYLRRGESAINITGDRSSNLNGEVPLEEVLAKLEKNVSKQERFNLDLHSIPKKKIGSFCYRDNHKEGIATIAKTVSFGLHHVFPSDRITRELSSLHNCEKFNNTKQSAEFGFIPDILKPYVKVLEIGVIFSEDDFLDGGILTQKGKDILSCTLESIDYYSDYTNIPEKERNLVPKVFSSSMEICHKEHKVFDESKEGMGIIRLVLPGGVKFACDPTDTTAESLDLILDFKTLARKGALGLFRWFNSDQIGQVYSYDECLSYFNQKLQKLDTITWNGTTYKGFRISCPVFRPGQRYDSFCKPTLVSTDLIARAILNKDYKVKKAVQEEYTKLIGLRRLVEKL